MVIICGLLQTLIGLTTNRAKLDGSILGKNTKVGAKAELQRCVTQAGYEVAAGGECFIDELDRR